jgi:hypothetical protein
MDNKNLLLQRMVLRLDSISRAIINVCFRSLKLNFFLSNNNKRQWAKAHWNYKAVVVLFKK